MSRITVIGAGAVGLSCAVRLAEAGHDVDVLARDLPPETTSAVAGGLWLPDLPERSEDGDAASDVTRWAADGLAELRRLAEAEPEAGVRVLPGTVIRPSAWHTAWATALGSLVPLAELPTLPAGAVGPGEAWRLSVPLVDTPRYLDHLRARLIAAGGTLTRLSLTALPSRGVVVNCTGVYAHALAGDPLVRPQRGQVVVLEDPGLSEWVLDEREQDGGFCYVLPHGGRVVVGASSRDGDWSTAVRPQEAEAVLRRARRLVPQLAQARVLGHRVGLRPMRPAMRVQSQTLTDADGAAHTMVHCYGHGRCGITLAWGSAGEVARMLAMADSSA